VRWTNRTRCDSLDPGATVKVSEFSRGGSARTVDPIRALDHHIRPDAFLVPSGILELTRGSQEIHQPWLAFSHSKGTSHFLADAIALWWSERREQHAGVTRLQIKLVSLPPYHSRYNPIERFRGVLKQHRHGTLVASVSLVLDSAQTVTWRGTCPIVREIMRQAGGWCDQKATSRCGTRHRPGKRSEVALT
jgi:hypothetical protein